MLPSPIRNAGITLIELLVVMAIMVTVLAVVGGTTIESTARAKAQTEIIKVYSLVKKTSVKAFSSGSSIDLEFGENAVSVFVEKKLQSKMTFEHLHFDGQWVRVNRNGYSDAMQLIVRVRDIKRELDLRPLFFNDTEGDT